MSLRVRLARWSCLLLIPLVGFTTVSHAEVKVPALSARVTDLTQTLSAPQLQALDQKLAAFEAQKGSQIAVLIVPTTAPEEIEQFSIRAAEAWKLGRKGVDDGVLLIVAKDDRTLRIEVGYGLEGAIPDLTAKRVIEEIITPRFRAEDFYGGIEQGVDRLIGLINGEALPPPPPEAGSGASGDSPGNIFSMAFFLIFAAGGALRAMFGRLLGAGIASVVAGIGGLLFGGLIGALIAGGLAFFLVLLGIGGIGFGGGRGRGGGFSGGGGGFGGGGASGRW